MSGTQTLNQSIQTLVESLETIKGDGLTLAQMMDEFSRAIESYKQYQAMISNGSLDVKEVKMNEAGDLIESNFNWQGM